MILSERIAAIVQYSKFSIPKFAEYVGFKTPQTVRELLKGNTRSLSDAVQYKITSAYPEINKLWLLTGEGEMLKDQTCTTSDTNTSANNEIAILKERIRALESILSEKERTIQILLKSREL